MSLTRARGWHRSHGDPPPVATIPLWRRDGTVGAFALVDPDDAVVLGEWNWCLSADGYAVRSVYLGGGQANRRDRIIRMHRFILGLQLGDPAEVDHINRSKLDNRRSNLRVVTSTAQKQNLSPVGQSSRFRGVYYSNTRARWVATAQVSGRKVHLGVFGFEEEAGAAAAAYRAEHVPFAGEEDVV